MSVVIATTPATYMKGYHSSTEVAWETIHGHRRSVSAAPHEHREFPPTAPTRGQGTPGARWTFSRHDHGKVSPQMLHWSQNSKPDLTEVKRAAYRLGFDVGKNNHMETVGWVRAELTSILSTAQKAGALQEVRQVYERGKREGRARRAGQGEGYRPAPVAGRAGMAHAHTDRTQAPKAPSLDDDGFTQRIAPEEGVKSTIGVMKFVGDDPRAKKDLTGMFAGIFDMQERILDIEPDPDMRKTFEKGLTLLREAGWVDGCKLASFDETGAVVTLRATTAIAKELGHSPEPLCQPICNLLETIGRKTFGVSVLVTETECFAQGKMACKFVIAPRKRVAAA